MCACFRHRAFAPGSAGARSCSSWAPWRAAKVPRNRLKTPPPPARLVLLPRMIPATPVTAVPMANVALAKLGVAVNLDSRTARLICRAACKLRSPRSHRRWPRCTRPFRSRALVLPGALGLAFAGLGVVTAGQAQAKQRQPRDDAAVLHARTLSQRGDGSPFSASRRAERAVACLGAAQRERREPERYEQQRER
jgi:hypothetical protein